MSKQQLPGAIRLEEHKVLSSQPADVPSAEAEDVDSDHEFNLNVDDSKLVQGNSSCATCMAWACIPCYPFTALCGLFTLEPNQEAVQLNYGTYTAKYDSPGVHWSNCWGRDLQKVSTRQRSIDLPTIKVLDSNGNPLMMSAILVYRIDNVVRSVLAVQQADRYINNQATATLRKIVSQFPYETADDSPSLKTHLSMVSQRLGQAAVKQLRPAGAEVIAFQVNEISYAPEIAGAMLKKQAAIALVQARQVLVKGCTDIAKDAVESLAQSGIVMKDEEKVRIVSNVLTVTCSDAQTVNTISVGLHDG